VGDFSFMRFARALGRSAVVAACAWVIAVPAAASQDSSSTASSSALETIGLGLDEALRLPAPGRVSALEDLKIALDALPDDDLSSSGKAAARFLSGQIHFALGDGRRAGEEFHGSRWDGDRKSFEDDAAFASIRAMEAEGRDTEAAREWTSWRRKFPQSALISEALLASAWNAVRRDSLRIAAVTLEELRAGSPWMAKEPRVVLLESTVLYLQSKPKEALAVLGEKTEGADATYLRALCLEADGAVLPAASRFQEVADRYPDSHLRDYALLAKANIFLSTKAYKSAAEEFARIAEVARDSAVRSEAELRGAMSIYFDGDVERGLQLLRTVAGRRDEGDVAARGQYLLGEVLYSRERYEDAIVQFNQVLALYFEHSLAARAQYRIGRSLDALGRGTEATSAYQAVVAGYSLSQESPAAAYLAGVGLLEQERPLAAVPYFQLVLDRYAQEHDGAFTFANAEQRELVEASLCLLELSYYRAGDLGQLSGVPHLMLVKMPPSDSPWRAYALLIDADALASQARYPEAQSLLETLIAEFPEHRLAVPANRLLAWTYSREGHDDLAIATEERMLDRYASSDDGGEGVSGAILHKGHILFNDKKYAAAGATYDEFAQRFHDHPDRLTALYQAGLCHLRLGNAGDAIDRWEAVVAADPAGSVSERAWARVGDLYFQAERYDDAKRCFRGLLENFSESDVSARALLRIAQCDYNASRDADAVDGFSEVIARYPNSASAKEAEKGIELALYRLGQEKGGDEVLAQLVERYPTSSFAADAQFEIATRLYDKKDYPAAAEAFRRVVTQFTSYAAVDRAHYLMADSYAKGGATKEARDAYEQFVTYFPSSELRRAVQFSLGSTRFEEKDYIRAAVDFTGVLESGPEDETARAALYNLGLCQIMLERPDEARATLKRFREGSKTGDPRAADAAYRVGELNERAGLLEEAVAEYQASLAAKPASGLAIELNYRIGSCRERLEDADGAIAAYRKALAGDDRGHPFHLSAVARLAALYENQEKYTEAIGLYRDLIRDSKDTQLVEAAEQRVAQLKAMSR
jgi:TolA-binding protein